MTQATLTVTPWAVVKHWIDVNRALAITLAGTILSAGIFGLLVIGVILRGEFALLWVNLVLTAYVLTWMLLATSATRTVGLWEVSRSVFSGFFLTMAFSYSLAKPMKILFGNNNFTVSVWVPLVEELGKLVAIGLLIWTLNRRYARASGLSDAVILGFGVGAGFLIHEDTLYPRSMTNHKGGGFAPAFEFSTGGFFPTNWEYGGDITISHPGWGLMIGFCVGVFFLLKSSRLLGALVVLAGFAAAVFGHGSWNHSSFPGFLLDLVSFTYPLLILFMVAGAIGVDLYLRHRGTPDLPKPRLSFYRRATALAESPLRIAERLMAMSRYRRTWNSIAYARAADRSLPSMREDDGAISWFLVGMGPVRGNQARPMPPPAGNPGVVPQQQHYHHAPVPPPPPHSPASGIPPQPPPGGYGAPPPGSEGSQELR